MGFYTKKPIKVEAHRLTKDNGYDLMDWCGGWYVDVPYCPDPNAFRVSLEIPTLEGIMVAQVGDYIIRGLQGEFYPCKSDIFDASYNYEPE